VFAPHERHHLWVAAGVPQRGGGAVRDRRSGLRIEKDAVIGDCEKARQLVADDDDGRPEAVPQIEDQIIQSAGSVATFGVGGKNPKEE
jgi:hypothetical protein